MMVIIRAYEKMFPTLSSLGAGNHGKAWWVGGDNKWHETYIYYNNENDDGFL